jgi:hypothetical protein
MKQLTILILISAGILCSCEETDPEISVVDYLVIGDINATVLMPGPNTIESSGNPLLWTASILDLDLDNDGTDDFRIVYSSKFSPMETYTKAWSIKLLNDGAGILCVDSPESPWYARYPEILVIGDTLKLTAKWRSEPLSPMITPPPAPVVQPPALDTSLSFLLATGYSMLFFDQYFRPYWVNEIYGYWIGATSKYIGVMLEKENGVYLGWIKVSVINSGIVVHEMGSKKLN